jgi:hypothetical protein
MISAYVLEILDGDFLLNLENINNVTTTGIIYVIKCKINLTQIFNATS